MFVKIDGRKLAIGADDLSITGDDVA